ncbi:hypothetical protein IMCC20628_01269 [Hoeflea sp. IMCC20628]|uniref:hypothetical protein n=1 Tax=Hoeflea sp. IMCC20628 TaxID=1620421 RepID=UPI00063ACF31|nr:hypothetical protein [Hoeflea sp. IMCC20628]AKH99985.1 hypothetical protein IMCC20628_01269 [Hoeflea sp. IMCC20628]
MKSLILVCLAATLGMMSAAQAEVTAGTYTVEGTNLDGSSYGGTATIELSSDTTCHIHWSTGTESNGICMLYDNAFAAGYVFETGTVGLVVYQVMDDGTLEGAWTIDGQSGSGTERLIPQ